MHCSHSFFICLIIVFIVQRIDCQEMSVRQAMKEISSIIKSVKVKEGAGFIVSRPFPGRVEQIDPFLLLDHIGPTKYGPGEAKGAPNHPHRGFETVTYMIQGEFQHKDSMGNKGFLNEGIWSSSCW